MPARHLGHDRSRLERLPADPSPVVRRPPPPAQHPVDHLEAAHLGQRLKSRVKSRHKTILRKERQGRTSGDGQEGGSGQRLLRAAARRETASPIIAGLFDLWDAELPRIKGKSKLAEAIRYASSRRPIIERYLGDGRIKIDSNVGERAIRLQAIVRKNALFAGSEGGGRT